MNRRLVIRLFTAATVTRERKASRVLWKLANDARPESDTRHLPGHCTASIEYEPIYILWPTFLGRLFFLFYSIFSFYFFFLSHFCHSLIVRGPLFFLRRAYRGLLCTTPGGDDECCTTKGIQVPILTLYYITTTFSAVRVRFHGQTAYNIVSRTVRV